MRVWGEARREDIELDAWLLDGRSGSVEVSARGLRRGDYRLFRG